MHYDKANTLRAAHHSTSSCVSPLSRDVSLCCLALEPSVTTEKIHLELNILKKSVLFDQMWRKHLTLSFKTSPAIMISSSARVLSVGSVRNILTSPNMHCSSSTTPSAHRCLSRMMKVHSGKRKEESHDSQKSLKRCLKQTNKQKNNLGKQSALCRTLMA